MSIFDLLFLLAILASIATMVMVVTAMVQGRRTQALKVLRIYSLCACAYLIAGIAVSFFAPQRVLRMGEPWCFDDWCLTVESSNRLPAETVAADGAGYKVELLISSRAGRTVQRANGAWIYLIDDRGRRYPPDPYPSAVPLDVLLQPNETAATSRSFHVSSNARSLGLITGHGGSYCGPMAFLIMGASGCLFGKPTMVRIP
jgi:hypothetical protein